MQYTIHKLSSTEHKEPQRSLRVLKNVKLSAHLPVIKSIHFFCLPNGMQYKIRKTYSTERIGP